MQFLLNKLFTYFGVIYHIVKLHNCSSLYSWVTATKISKYLLSQSITGRQFLLNKSFTYFWVIYHIVKLQNFCSLDGRVIATKMSKCLLSLKVLQSNIKVPLAYCYFYMYLVHQIYMAGDNCMRQNACFFTYITYFYTTTFWTQKEMILSIWDSYN